MDDAILSLAVVGNVLNLAYNVPLVWRVIKLWDAENLSKYFLAMRVSGSIIWLFYAVAASDAWVGISYTVTLASSLLLTMVKICPRRATVEVLPDDRPGTRQIIEV